MGWNLPAIKTISISIIVALEIITVTTGSGLACGDRQENHSGQVWSSQSCAVVAGSNRSSWRLPRRKAGRAGVRLSSLPLFFNFIKIRIAAFAQDFAGNCIARFSFLDYA